MKKIININLSGRVIPIEDSAYESLQQYIESLRRYFAAEEGRDEIINDIESRVAELMAEKVRKGAAAVTDADIEEIITAMGRVEDFEKADTADEKTTGQAFSQKSANHSYSEKKRFTGRLYRDASDKMIGGVCAGIANYANIDPAIIRLLFAIITFGGFGFGIFIYILAWIILPTKSLEGYVGKRLFRNPDDRIIGGVASGLAAYFNKEAWVVRLIFAAPFLLNIIVGALNGFFNFFHGPDFSGIFIGSFSGTFVLAYIILWVVLPEAKSSFEKMEMRGETVDVNRIRQNVQDRAQSWGEEVKTSAQQFSERAKVFANTRAKTFAAEVSQTARPVASGIGHAIGILFKAFFLFIAGSIAFALFVAVLMFTMSGIATPVHEFLIDGFWQRISLWGVLIFFLAVPLIAFITWMVRRLMKVRSQNRYLGWIFGGLWTIGFIFLPIFISTLARDFRYYNKIEERVYLPKPEASKMLVRIDEPAIRYSGRYSWLDIDDEGFDITDDSLFMSNIKIRMAKSNNAFYQVTIRKYSAGSNRQEALSRAELITFNTSSIDSVLILGSGYGIGKKQKFRGQKIIVEIKIPVGKKIMFDESVANKMRNDVDIRIAENMGRNHREWDEDWNYDNYFDYHTNVDYVMTEEGELKEVNNTQEGEEKNGEDIYEYKKEKSKNELQKSIEEKERQLEEDRKKLEEIEGSTFNFKSEHTKGTAQIPLSFSPIII